MTLVSAPSETLRQHLDQAKAWSQSAKTDWMPEVRFRQILKHVEGALAILDNATIPTHGDWVRHRNYRLVPDPVTAQMESCSNCRGYGVHMSGEDVVNCRECGYSGSVEAQVTPDA